MVERNLFKEGFIFNTLMSNGAVSGTQTPSLPEINALVDDDFSTTAVTVSATETTVLDADFGARFKLNRIELYTDETDIANVDMFISDNNADFFEVTMTGSPPLYVGDIQDSTVSGAPRYVRYEHRGDVGDTLVREWRAMSDDTLVDFGADGLTTQVEITDAPIGRASTQVQKLALLNQHDRPGTAYVMFDETGTDADELVEVSKGPNGPWFGHSVDGTFQPDVIPWVSGTLTNTRVVTASGLFVEFVGETDATDTGWSGDGLSTTAITSNVWSVNTTSTTPRFEHEGNYNSELPTEEVEGKRFVVRADDYDTVRVRLKAPTIVDLVEGPSLWWRGFEEDSDPFDSTPSQKTFSTAGPSVNYTGQEQDFVFDMSGFPTWSGGVRGFRIQPFVASTGIAIPLEFHELEVYHSSQKDRVTLQPLPTASGQKPIMNKEDADDFGSNTNYISFGTRITQRCIITKIRTVVAPSTAAGITGCFLAKFADPSPSFNFPASGTNFIVKAVVTQRTSPGIIASLVNEYDVFWPAEPGDFLGYSRESSSTGQIHYRTNTTDPLYSAHTTNSIDLNSGLSVTQEDMDEAAWTLTQRVPLIWFESVALDDYFASGTYRTPIFDSGFEPNLLTDRFEAIEPGDSSIDVSGLSTHDTINARAASTPPLPGKELGTTAIGKTRLNEDVTDPTNAWLINKANSFVMAREGTSFNSIKNLGSAILYHQFNDEIWVCNVLASGTEPLDIRPIWDVYDPNDFSYIRTQHMTGDINYSYDAATSFDETMEPVGFIGDWSNSEIYIICRENSFFINTSTYYAVVMDTEGTFKRVSWRSDAMNFPNENRMPLIQSVTFDGTYFYLLTDDFALNNDRIVVVRRGATTDPTLIEYVDEELVHNMGGDLALTVDGTPHAEQIIYNNHDGKLYMLFSHPLSNSTTLPTERVHRLFTLDISFDSDEDFTFSLASVSGTAPGLDEEIDGFAMDPAGTTDDSQLIQARDLQFNTTSTFDPNRDRFYFLQNHQAQQDPDVPEDDSYTLDFKSIGFLSAINAASSGTAEDLPPYIVPRSDDPIWGTLSGSLDFTEVQRQSVLFPTGRYAQVEYQLNASSGRDQTPALTESQLGQGLLVGGIPANGTVDIYLRTNIPDGETLGDRLARLKVFWELPE